MKYNQSEPFQNGSCCGILPAINGSPRFTHSSSGKRRHTSMGFLHWICSSDFDFRMYSRLCKCGYNTDIRNTEEHKIISIFRLLCALSTTFSPLEQSQEKLKRRKARKRIKKRATLKRQMKRVSFSWLHTYLTEASMYLVFLAVDSESTLGIGKT